MPEGVLTLFTLSDAYRYHTGQAHSLTWNDINLFNHNNNSADDYVQLNTCGCWIVRLVKPALKTIQ